MSQKRLVKKRKLDVNPTNQGFYTLHRSLHSAFYDIFNSAMNGKIDDDGPTINNYSISRNPWRTDYPFAPFEPIHTECIKDFYKELVELKETYKTKLLLMQRMYKRRHSKTNWLQQSKKSQYFHLPSYMVDLMSGVVADPDPFFNSHYNYYYNGGTMCKLFIDDEEHFVRPVYDNKICFQNLETKNVGYIDSPEQIYNINSYFGPNNIKNYFSVRHKKRIFLKEITEKFNDKTLFKMQLEKAEAPFIDVKYHDGKIAYTDVIHNFHIKDLETEKLSEKIVLPLENNASGACAQFEFTDDNTIIYVENTNVHVVDRRTGEFKTENLLHSQFTCNDILQISKIDSMPSYLYLTTAHNLIKFDLRQLKVVRKWSHMLDVPPVTSKLFECNGELGWAVGSLNEIMLLRMNDSENYLPLKLTDVNEVYHKTNLHKKLTINEDLVKRIKLSTVGIEYCHKRNKCKSDKYSGAIYTSNCIGDIFQHNLADDLDLPNAMSKMVEWISKLKPIHRTLKVTGIVDMSIAKDMITKKTLHNNLEIYTKKVDKKLIFQKLKVKCSDHNFKQIWNETDEIPEDMVQTWMDTNDFSQS